MIKYLLGNIVLEAEIKIENHLPFLRTGFLEGTRA